MQRSSIITVEQRVRLIQLSERGYGYESAARLVGCGRKSSQNLWHRRHIRGSRTLVPKRGHTVYSFEIKLQAVRRFVDGESKPTIVKDLGLCSPINIESLGQTLFCTSQPISQPNL